MIQISRSEVLFEMRSQDGVDVIDITGQLDAFTTAETKAEFKTLIDDRHEVVLGKH